MPILARDELSSYIDESVAKLLTKEPKGFERTESAVADLIHRKTGLEIPADANNAPDWAKEAAALLITARRIGSIARPSDSLVSWAKWAHDQALTTLAEHKESTPTDRTGAEYLEIEGVRKW